MTIHDFLKARGYSDQVNDPLHGVGTIYWYRRAPETERHQYVVRMYNSPTIRSSFEVEMTFETRGEVWANQKFYGLSEEDLKANLDRLEACLKQALLYMDANPLHYRFDGRN